MYEHLSTTQRPANEHSSEYFTLTQEIAAIVNRPLPLVDCLNLALECICTHLRWEVGHVLLQSRRRPANFYDSGIWWMADEARFAPLVREARRIVHGPGMSPIGAVIALGKPQRIVESITAHAPEGSPGYLAGEFGLKAGIALPILIEDRVKGVIEFYTSEANAVDDRLLDAAGQIGIMLGRPFERAEFNRMLAQTARREHRRIGRQLHDTVGQQLTGISMMARSVQRTLEARKNPEAERVAALVQNISEAAGQVRALARGLSPIDIEVEDLSGAIAKLIKQTGAAFEIHCSFTSSGSLELDDDLVATELCYIIREIVHNAAKHSKGSNISVVANGTSEAIEVCIVDDGTGFSPQDEEGRGIGMRIVRHRADLIGAKLAIESEQGHGTTVTLLLDRRNA